MKTKLLNYLKERFNLTDEKAKAIIEKTEADKVWAKETARKIVESIREEHAGFEPIRSNAHNDVDSHHRKLRIENKLVTEDRDQAYEAKWHDYDPKQFKREKE